MKILAISTSSSTCSVAILENNIPVCELNITNTKTHSENLMPLIDKSLNKCNMKLSDINLIACDNGPGSFTGIRIGISTVKSLAEVYNLPVIDVSSLEALSYNLSANTICSMLDARNNQVYCGIFDSKHELLEKYMANDIKIIFSTLQNYKNISFVGDGAFLHRDLLNTNNICDDLSIHANNVGLCAFNKYKKGIIKNADTILPMYLRKSQAERMKK